MRLLTNSRLDVLCGILTLGKKRTVTIITTLGYEYFLCDVESLCFILNEQECRYKEIMDYDRK